MELFNLNDDYFFYTFVALFFIEQFLYYVDFYYIYKFSIKIKEIPVASLVLKERKVRINFLSFTKNRNAVLIRFSPPFGGAVPLPFVGIIKEQSNDKLIVKIGPATLALIGILLFPSWSIGGFAKVFYGLVVLIFVYFIFVRRTRETIRT